MSIYEQAVAVLPPSDIDHHESDLYLRKTPESARLIEGYKFRQNVTTFIDGIENVIWYEVPFAYDPFWNERK